MNHPYLRAYMAGIVVPTAFLLVVMIVFTLARFVFDVPVPIERVVVFPMALIPNLFGLWNIFYVGLRSRGPARSARTARCCRLSSSPGPHARDGARRHQDGSGRTRGFRSGQTAVP